MSPPRSRPGANGSGIACGGVPVAAVADPTAEVVVPGERRVLVAGMQGGDPSPLVYAI